LSLVSTLPAFQQNNEANSGNGRIINGEGNFESFNTFYINFYYYDYFFIFNFPDTEISKIPHQVLVITTMVCGGSLITLSKVLTAAHCTQ
jgi:hypothetical protein